MRSVAARGISHPLQAHHRQITACRRMSQHVGACHSTGATINQTHSTPAKAGSGNESEALGREELPSVKALLEDSLAQLRQI